MTEAPRIVLVENDYLLRKGAVEELCSLMGGRGVEIVDFGTEHGLRSQLPEFIKHPPAAFVLGEWFRWADPDMPILPPDDWGRDGYKTAALRCQQLIHNCSELAGTPIIIWSNFDEQWMRETFGNPPPGNVRYTRKSSDLGELMRLVQSTI